MAQSEGIPAALLGVERSITGKRWRGRPADDRLAYALSQRLGVPDILGRVLAARGVDLDHADSFLNPTLRDLLPDPSRLRDMDKAVDRLVRAIRGREKIAIFGDYDVDGATSAALLSRFLRGVGTRAVLYVPDRIKEGYGPNSAAFDRLRTADGATLVITVDCGTTAFDTLAAARAGGLDVVVIDHHVGEPLVPDAVAVVNPNRLDEDLPDCGQLAAVGVTYLVIVALNRALRESGFYGAEFAEPNLLESLDLVALGTVCDVVPLTGVNRALVTQGLKVMARRSNAGINALAAVARLDQRPDSYHAGFLLGPRVNAGGRVGESDLGVRLLTTEDPLEAAAIAERLDRHNGERQAIEGVVLEQAMAQAADRAAPGQRLIVVAGEGWHPGVIGIVAGRLRERFNVPACVVALDEGVGKGSGRSVPGVALGPAVIAAHQAGLLINGGGHAMAAGFTVEAGKLAAFAAFLDDHIAGQLGGRQIEPGLSIDATLHPNGATLELAALLERVGPFGAGNPRPRFVLPNVRIRYADTVGTNHVRIEIEAAEGESTRLKGIAFRAGDGPLGPALLDRSGTSLHLAGTLQENQWRGTRSPQFMVEDAAVA